ncbi:MAG TPA: hypothetical protein VHE79_03870, partial [Spirochaetia bacterium]
DVPEWSGQWLSWFLPLIGAISVFPGRYHSESITTIRRSLFESPHPLALAPEGQLSYHNERVPALETGTAQLAFWCMEDLRKASRTEDVVILPVCTSYHYDPRDWKGLVRLLARVEREVGLEPAAEDPSAQHTPPDGEGRLRIYERTLAVTDRIASLAEAYYERFYGVHFHPSSGGSAPEELQGRLTAICEAVLSMVEERLQLVAKGDFVRRVMAIRQAGFLRQCRDDIADLDALSPVEKRMADRVAQEAWLLLRHMELIDVLEYFDMGYLAPDSSFDRFVETITDLWDIANRLEGGNVSGRVNPFWKTARIVVNEPIAVSSRWDAYVANRRRAVDELTDDILKSFRSVAEPADRGVRRSGV